MNLVLVAFTTDVDKYVAVKKDQDIFSHMFLAISDLESQYQNLWPYQNAVLILDCLTFKPPKLNKEELLTKNYNANYITLKLLKLLRYKQVLICLDLISESNLNCKKIEESIHGIFNEDERDSDFRKNALKLLNPQIKVVSKFSSDVIKQFFHQNYIIDNLLNVNVECVVVKILDKVHIIRVLQGQLHEGQLLYSLKTKAFIKSINLDKFGQIQVTFEQDSILEGILWSHTHNPEVIKQVCVDVQLCELPIYAAKDAFRKMGKIIMFQYNQQFILPNTRANQIESHGQLDQNKEFKRLDQQTNFNLIKIEFSLDKQQFLNIQQQPILFFTNEYKEILFYGKLSSITEKVVQNKEKAPYFILPKFILQNQNLMINGIDLRYFCRICKKQPLSRLIQDCGHLRYCGECIEFCLEAKECYYCSQKVTKVHPIKVQFIEAELYSKVKIKKEAIKTQEQTQVVLQKNVSPYNQIVSQLLKEGNLNFHSFYCQHCDQNISEQFYVCQSDHMIFICCECKPKECITCQKLVTAQNIIKYQFADDECQI